MAGASLPYTIILLVALTKIAASLTWQSWIRLSLPVLALGALIFSFLIYGGALVPGDLVPLVNVDADLTAATRPVNLSIATLELPGLVGLLALRQVAVRDATRDGPQRCSMLLLIRLRADLRRSLALLGVALTLLVIATGMRRRTLLAFDPALPIPEEQVLMYGLIFAALLGLLFMSASAAIDARAASTVDGLEPFPDPQDDTFAARLKRRADLASAMGSASSFASFQSAVVITAPLLSALIGTSTGS